MYLAAAVALGALFVSYALRIYSPTATRWRKTFRYSIAYLAFAALLVDHYL